MEIRNTRNHFALYLDYIVSIVVTVLISFSNIIIGIAILKFLSKTTDENLSNKIYTKPISIGVVFIFIIKSIIAPISPISGLIFNLEQNYDYFEIYLWFSYGIYWFSFFIFIIGIIFLSIGATKTMSVPLIFSKEKDVKQIQPNATKFCSNCGTPLQAGAQFCMNCGRKR
ncbi:MAG: zinc ribbon domain-containing protein [Promethearchaeota archaeon]